MSRTQWQVIAVVFIVMFYVLTKSTLAMSLAVVAALVFMIPDRWFKRIAGYVVVCDILASGYIFSSFMGVSAVSAAEIGVFAALGISVTLRVIRLIVGADRLSVNDTTATREVFAHLFSQGVAWSKALTKAITTGKVIPPAPLKLEWIEVQPGLGLLGAIQSVF